jgi:bacterioferritin-associated ferredoxin
VPAFFRHTVLRAEAAAAQQVERVVIGPVDALGRRRPGRTHGFDVDSLAVGHGLVPGSDIPRLLRAAHRYDRQGWGWVPVMDGLGRTSLSGLYACGDGAGIGGGQAAGLAGTMAGLAAAMDAGRLSADAGRARLEALARDRTRALRFAAAIGRLTAPRPGLTDEIGRDVVVCRCEEVTRGEIDDAVARGAREVNQLKQFTRCGMGPCQGRLCGETAAELLARHVGSREAAGQWTMRPPLRPVDLGSLLGSFSYDDIPVPEPAPL